MDAYESIVTRRSIRAFKPDPIGKETMKKIIEAAKNSPSYLNTQPWEVVVVSGKRKNDLSQKLFSLAGSHAPTSPDIPMPKGWPPQLEEHTREHGARRLNTLGIERSDSEGREKLRLMNFKFYGAPCAVFLFMDGSLGEWSLLDMGLFTQNLVLAAHSIGVGCCIQASVTEYAGEIKKFFTVDENKKMVACISMGYPDHEAKLNAYRSIKKDINEFFFWYE